MPLPVRNIFQESAEAYDGRLAAHAYNNGGRREQMTGELNYMGAYLQLGSAEAARASAASDVAAGAGEQGETDLARAVALVEAARVGVSHASRYLCDCELLRAVPDAANRRAAAVSAATDRLHGQELTAGDLSKLVNELHSTLRAEVRQLRTGGATGGATPSSPTRAAPGARWGRAIGVRDLEGGGDLPARAGDEVYNSFSRFPENSNSFRVGRTHTGEDPDRRQLVGRTHTGEDPDHC
jgi:hypothetical protein